MVLCITQAQMMTDVAGYEESGGRLSIAGPISDNLSLYASIRSNQFDGPNNNWARELGRAPNFNILLL